VEVTICYGYELMENISSKLELVAVGVFFVYRTEHVLSSVQ
jgi:hypothetical protein